MSAVTGEPISVIRDAIRHVSGRVETADGRAYLVIGVRPIVLVNAMQLLGWEVIEKSGIENNAGLVPAKRPLGAATRSRGPAVSIAIIEPCGG
jgi:hypothetical protein